MPWNPNSGRKYTAAKSCNVSISPSDLEMIDERAKLLGTGRSGAIRSLLRDARRAARTGVAPAPALVYVPEAPRPTPRPVRGPYSHTTSGWEIGTPPDMEWHKATGGQAHG